MHKGIIFILGLLITIIGIALVLHYWSMTEMVFKGVVPPAIAVAGLVMMFAASIKK